MDIEVYFKTAVLSAFVFCSLRAVLANAPGSSNENICKEENGTCEWLASSNDYNGNVTSQQFSLSKAATLLPTTVTLPSSGSAVTIPGSDVIDDHNNEDCMVAKAGAAATDMHSVSVEIVTAETSGKDPEPVAPAKTEVLVMEALAAEVNSAAPEVMAVAVDQMAGEPVAATVPSDKPAAPKMVASKPTSGDSNEMRQAAMEEPIASVADLVLEELRSLLQQAHMAVSRLEAEVIRQERRLTRLAAATTASVASLAGSSAAALEPAVEAAGTAVLRSLGIDGSSMSTAVRQALREVLEQILRGRTMTLGHAEKGSGASGRTSLTRTAPAFAGVAQEDWFGRHFAVRAAAWLLPPPPSPPEVAEADAAMLAEPAIPTPATITCAFAYELPHPNAAASGGGALQYIVAGDATGVLYILSPADGSVMAVLSSGADSAVTACSAFYVRRYESTVVTGHANGQTRSFAVILQEGEENEAGENIMTDTRSKQRRRQSNSRTMGTDKLVVQSVRLRHVVESMPPGALPWAAVQEMPSEAIEKAPAKMMMEPAAEAGGEQAADVMGKATESQYTGLPAPIMHILPYRLGNKVTGRRHVLVVDRAGNLRLERDNGTLRFWARTNRTQLAARLVGTHAVMLSACHATLINTLQPRPPRAYTCNHLNGSRLLAASFDSHRTFRGYGINDRGELLSMVTPHDGGLATCKVHRATQLPWLDSDWLSNSSNSHSLLLTPLRGYLLLTYGSQRVLFNVTGVVRTGIPMLSIVSDEFIAGAANAVTSMPEGTTSAQTARPSGPVGNDLIGGMLPPPSVVTVGPGSQVVVLALPSAPTLLAAPGVSAPADSGISYTVQEQEQQPQTTSGLSELAGADGLPSGSGACLLVMLNTRMPRPPVSAGASKIWSQPVFLVAMLLVGLYQFWRMSSTRNQRRSMPSASRANHSRRVYGAGYGRNSCDSTAEYMYSENRVPLQPRSVLRRGRSDRPMGRSVTYKDEDY